MVATAILQSRTFQSTATGSSTRTKIKLPIEEAVKAGFPPGCKVLCFDDNGFRVGVVKNVMVSISLPSNNTFGTFYEVEMKGSDGLNSSILGIFSSSDLRLTPDCPVEVNAEYFGSVFKNAGGSRGSVSGTILGSFEIPPSRCNRCVQKLGGVGGGGDQTPPPRKFFYSVRVKFHGMQEAVEAHGVPSEYIAVQSSNGSSDSSTILSEGSDPMVFGGGRFHDNDGQAGDDCKENHSYELSVKSPTRKRPQRMTPEDMPLADQNAFKSNVMEGCFQESFNDSFNVMYHHESSTKSFSNTIANGDRELYDSEAGSSFEALEKQNTQRGRSNSVHRNRSRSTSRTRIYEKPKSSRSVHSNKIPSRTMPTPERILKVAPSSSVEEDSMNDYFDDDTQYEEETKQIERNNKRSVETTHVQANGANADFDESEHHYEDRDEPVPTPKARSRSDSRSYRDIANSVAKEDTEEQHRSENEDSSYHSDGTPSRNKTEDSSYHSYSASSRSKTEHSPNPRDRTPSRDKKKFGNTWSPSVRSSSSKKVESSRDPSPVVRRVSSKTQVAPSVASVEEIPPVDEGEMPVEGCYLIFDPNSGGKLTINYSKTVVEGAIGFWCPGKGKNIQGFKFKQNQGRSDLMRDIAGKDYKKKYFNGWCQFIKAAKTYNGSLCKWSEHERIELDIYVFFSDKCEVKKIEDGELFDVTNIDAVTCLPKGNATFTGVKTGEYGTFLNRGDAAGASMAVGR
jgi:hypothetical protein